MRERERQRETQRDRRGDEHVNVQQANKCVYVSNKERPRSLFLSLKIY